MTAPKKVEVVVPEPVVEVVPVAPKEPEATVTVDCGKVDPVTGVATV